MNKKNNTFIIILLSFFAGLLTSCEIINPEEQTPSFLSIDSISLTTTAGQGTAKHKIQDAWVYIDEEIVGAFEMPVIFPVLAEGTHKITIRPGIKLNGIAATRAYYPFFEPIVFSINLLAGKTIKLDTLVSLKTKYYSNTIFPWNFVGQEDFEDGGTSLDSTQKSKTSMKTTTTDVFEGNRSGIIILKDSINTFEVKSNIKYTLPKGGKPVFLEFHYKTNNSFTVGLFINGFSQSIQYPLLVVNPTNKWNKIYINLTSVVSRESNALDFNVFFGANLDAGNLEAKILLDNIKLVHN